MLASRSYTIACAALLLCLGCARPLPAPPLQTSVYVWQEQWSPALNKSVKEASGAVGEFAVLAGFVDAGETAPSERLIRVDWQVFQHLGRPVWAVLRAHALPGLDTPAGQAAATESLSRLMARLREVTRRAGVTLAGFQLDYDCPTEGLPGYAAWVARVARHEAPARLSITALPAWLGQPALRELISPLDHFILQVHSLEKPGRIGNIAPLCDAAKVPAWLTQAGELGRPFLVALPTYGYRLYFSEDGAFTGLAAEGSREALAGKAQELHADPVVLAALVRDLESHPPPNLRGTIWFRLPVEHDRLNWSWSVLASVMQGSAPAPRLEVEVRSPSGQLYEVWLANRSGFHLQDPVHISLRLSPEALLASDTLADFTLDPSGLVLRGPAPPPGDSILAAWFRMRPEGSHNVSAVRASIGEQDP